MRKIVVQVLCLNAMALAFLFGSSLASFAQSDFAEDGSKNRFYRGLANALNFYRTIEAEGGWPRIPSGKALVPGRKDKRIPILRKRLSITGDFLGVDLKSETYDKELKRAVIAYQNRNGQVPDGIVGKGTLASLNIPVSARIRKMEINQERWNRMPPSLGQRFVLVNMAGFELEVIEGRKTVLDMKVIVGKDYNNTPSFSDIIKTIEFEPFWNVPPSIANEELVPQYANKGIEKAQEQGFEIVRGGKPDPLTAVNWTDYLGKVLPFEIRQRPGPANALGDMKFLFPNKHNVYLHDTNARGLFARTVRAFSHGCVRVEKPRELAAYLLAANGDWPQSRVNEVADSGVNTRVELAAPTPVHLAYMTAWVNRQGFVQFRPDIYGRDAALAQELSGQ